MASSTGQGQSGAKASSVGQTSVKAAGLNMVTQVRLNKTTICQGTPASINNGECRANSYPRLRSVSSPLL